MIKTFRHNKNAYCRFCGTKMNEVTGIKCLYLVAEREFSEHIYICKECLNDLATKCKRAYYVDKFDEDECND